MKKTFILFILSSCAKIFSQDVNADSIFLKQVYPISNNSSLQYSKPRISDLYKKIPKNLVAIGSDIVSKNLYGYSLAALGSTMVLIPADPTLIKASRKLGENIGFNVDHSYSNLGPLKIIPNDFGSFIYFMGNGTTFIIIGAGLATYGLITNDYRSQSTAIQLVQSILLSGIIAQPLKRITGRESPFETIGNGRDHSHWTFLPSFSAYQTNTSKYDAMPSGHFTTGIAAWIILSENYPEKKWIKPLGFTLMGLMTFEMAQSNVHWYSDYPIAVLLGYLIGRNVVKNARVKNIEISEITQKRKYKINISSSNLYGTQLAGSTIDF